MSTFADDLKTGLNFTSIICEYRARQWRTQWRPLLEWQHEAFNSLLLQIDPDSKSTIWVTLNGKDRIPEQFALLHSELRAIIDFQRPIVESLSVNQKDLEADSAQFNTPKRAVRPFKKAIELMVTLLESIKEIFGGLLGPKGNAALQLAIEAGKAFV